jgi:hypothetical protein
MELVPWSQKMHRSNQMNQTKIAPCLIFSGNATKVKQNLKTRLNHFQRKTLQPSQDLKWDVEAGLFTITSDRPYNRTLGSPIQPPELGNLTLVARPSRFKATIVNQVKSISHQRKP